MRKQATTCARRHACFTSPARTSARNIYLPRPHQGPEKGPKRVNSPTVPLPPTGITPKRLNGTEKVTTFGVTSRMTMTSAGLVGINLSDILLLLFAEEDVEKGLYTGISPLSTPTPIATAGKRRMAVLRGPGRRLRVDGDVGLVLLVE